MRRGIKKIPKYKKEEIIKWAKEAIDIEAKAALELKVRIGDEFVRAVELIVKSKGKVVSTGMGKAGIIAQKFSATLSSTGTPSIWLHPAEAVHGDLGRVSSEDVAVVFSYSGETDEIKALLPFLKKIGSEIIAICGERKSFLAQYADIFLNAEIEREACALGLAPTTSTTVMLVLSDSLAICLQRVKGFREKDFALFHPQGSLGRKLILKVSDVMRKGKRNPLVSEDKKVSEVLLLITQARAGAAVIVDKKQHLAGIFTDGDLRRHLGKTRDILSLKVEKVMTKNPIAVGDYMLAEEAMRILQQHRIDEVPVIDKKGKVVGLLDVQDLLKAGIV